METLVFLTLRKKFKEVYYWKEKGEVDFVVESEQGIQPIQVTLGEEKERHKTGLAEFALKIPNSAQPVLITRDNLERFLLNTDQFFI